jgi:hypothetical protein
MLIAELLDEAAYAKVTLHYLLVKGKCKAEPVTSSEQKRQPGSGPSYLMEMVKESPDNVLFLRLRKVI